MLKKFYLLILLLNLGNNYGQVNIKVIYSASFIGDFLNDESKKNLDLVSTMNGIENKINSLKFELYIEGSKSIFQAKTQIIPENESQGEKIGRIFAGQEDKHYLDTAKKEKYTNVEVSGTKYNVQNDYNYVIWILTNETKIINGYECYKATWKYRNIDVYAWYCPKLPYSAGPIGYGNLPGLILELQRGKLIYLATSIDLGYNGDMNIELSKDKLVSEIELDKIVEKSNDNMLNK